MACMILVPRPGIEPAFPALEAWSLNRWITKKVLRSPYFWMVYYTLPSMWLEFYKVFVAFFFSSLIQPGSPSLFFFSVLMRYNWKNYKICKVYIMVMWYTDLLWKVNLPSAVLDLFGQKSPPGPSGLAGFSFAVTSCWFSHPRGHTFPHYVGAPTYTYQWSTWRAPT